MTLLRRYYQENKKIVSTELARVITTLQHKLPLVVVFNLDSSWHRIYHCYLKLLAQPPYDFTAFSFWVKSNATFVGLLSDNSLFLVAVLLFDYNLLADYNGRYLCRQHQQPDFEYLSSMTVVIRVRSLSETPVTTLARGHGCKLVW